MYDVIMQLSHAPMGGSAVLLATSKNLALACAVAQHILGGLSNLKFEDKVLDQLAKQEEIN